MAVLYEPLKGLGLPSWSLASFTVIDDIGIGIDGWGLGGIDGLWWWWGRRVESR